MSEWPQESAGVVLTGGAPLPGGAALGGDLLGSGVGVAEHACDNWCWRVLQKFAHGTGAVA